MKIMNRDELNWMADGTLVVGAYATVGALNTENLWLGNYKTQLIGRSNHISSTQGRAIDTEAPFNAPRLPEELPKVSVGVFIKEVNALYKDLNEVCIAMLNGQVQLNTDFVNMLITEGINMTDDVTLMEKAINIISEYEDARMKLADVEGFDLIPRMEYLVNMASELKDHEGETYRGGANAVVNRIARIATDRAIGTKTTCKLKRYDMIDSVYCMLNAALAIISTDANPVGRMMNYFRRDIASHGKFNVSRSNPSTVGMSYYALLPILVSDLAMKQLTKDIKSAAAEKMISSINSIKEYDRKMIDSLEPHRAHIDNLKSLIDMRHEIHDQDKKKREEIYAGAKKARTRKHKVE